MRKNEFPKILDASCRARPIAELTDEELEKAIGCYIHEGPDGVVEELFRLRKELRERVGCSWCIPCEKHDMRKNFR